MFITIELVDGAGAGRFLVGVLPVYLYELLRTNMPMCGRNRRMAGGVHARGSNYRAQLIYQRAVALDAAYLQ